MPPSPSSSPAAPLVLQWQRLLKLPVPFVLALILAIYYEVFGVIRIMYGYSAQGFLHGFGLSFFAGMGTVSKITR
jgi:hypothetical protein